MLFLFIIKILFFQIFIILHNYGTFYVASTESLK